MLMLSSAVSLRNRAVSTLLGKLPEILCALPAKAGGQSEKTMLGEDSEESGSLKTKKKTCQTL